MVAVGESAGVMQEPANDVGAPPWIDPTVDRTLLLIALAVTLAISRLPGIVLRGFGLAVPSFEWVIVAATIVLWAASRMSSRLRPFERYLAVMVAINVAVAALPVVLDSQAWRSLVPDTTQPMVEI